MKFVVAFEKLLEQMTLIISYVVLQKNMILPLELPELNKNTASVFYFLKLKTKVPMTKQVADLILVLNGEIWFTKNYMNGTKNQFYLLKT